MHSKSDNKEIVINDKAVEVFEEFFNHFLIDIKIMILSLIMFSYCVINVVVDHV